MPKENREPKKPGRHTKLTPEVHKSIVDALGIGNYFDQAVRSAKVHPATAYRWMSIGEETPEIESDEFDALSPEMKIVAVANQPFREFREAVLDAIAEAEVADITVITQAGLKDWRAIAWKRERISPDRWGRTDKLVIHQAAMEELTSLVVNRVEQAIASTIPDPQLRKTVLAAILGAVADAGEQVKAPTTRT